LAPRSPDVAADPAGGLPPAAPAGAAAPVEGERLVDCDPPPGSPADPCCPAPPSRPAAPGGAGAPDDDADPVDPCADSPEADGDGEPCPEEDSAPADSEPADVDSPVPGDPDCRLELELDGVWELVGGSGVGMEVGEDFVAHPTRFAANTAGSSKVRVLATWSPIARRTRG